MPSMSYATSGMTSTTKGSTIKMGRTDKKKLKPFYHPVYHGSASSNATTYITPKYSPRKSINRSKPPAAQKSKPASHNNGTLVDEAVERVQI